MSDWQTFTGEYDKDWYDVLPHGHRDTSRHVIPHCWPNAGLMCATDGSGRMWKPGECYIRKSAKHPLEASDD